MKQKLALLLLTLAALGCNREPSLVGRWSLNTADPEEEPTYIFSFNEDKSMQLEVKKEKLVIDLVGTYDLKGKELTIKLKDVKLKGVEKGVDVDVKKQVLDRFKAKQKSTIGWNGSDELAITYEKKTDLMKRLKDEPGK